MILNKKNISLYKLQKYTDVSTSTLRKYRDDVIKQLDKEVIAKICKALECDIKDLLILEDKDKNENK